MTATLTRTPSERAFLSPHSRRDPPATTPSSRTPGGSEPHSTGGVAGASRPGPAVRHAGGSASCSDFLGHGGRRRRGTVALVRERAASALSLSCCRETLVTDPRGGFSGLLPRDPGPPREGAWPCPSAGVTGSHRLGRSWDHGSSLLHSLEAGSHRSRWRRAGPCIRPVPPSCWLVDASFRTPLRHCHMAVLPPRTCPLLPVSPVLTRTPAIGLGPTPVQRDLILTSYISKQGHILGSWGWDVARESGGAGRASCLPKYLPSLPGVARLLPSLCLPFPLLMCWLCGSRGRGRRPWWALRPGQESRRVGLPTHAPASPHSSLSLSRKPS